MLELKWKESYLIGDKMIDGEHQRLFEIAQAALMVVDPSERKKKIKEMVINVYEYTKTHFEHEEKYMRSIQYPQLQEHQRIHEHIVGLMNAFIQKLPAMNIVEFEKEMAYFIQTLIVGHIITEDKKIALWKEKAEKIAPVTAVKKEYSDEQDDIVDLDDDNFKLPS